MSNGIKVGTVLYQFDANRRIYNRPGLGGSVIYREHFSPVTVVGETSKSWLVDGYREPRKVNKATMQIANRGYGATQIYTSDGMEDKIWSYVERRRIMRAVEYCDVPTLRQIDSVLSAATGTNK